MQRRLCKAARNGFDNPRGVVHNGSDGRLGGWTAVTTLSVWLERTEPSNTVFPLLLTKVLRRPLHRFGTLGPIACYRYSHLLSLRLASRCLPAEQPESTPRVSYPTTQLSVDFRIDFAVVCRVVFRSFPCCLGLGSPAPTTVAPASGQC